MLFTVLLIWKKNGLTVDQNFRLPWLLLIIAVSIVVKGELANETVNYYTKTKAYVPIRAGKVIKTGSPGERTDFRSSSQTSN